MLHTCRVCIFEGFLGAGLPGDAFATAERALDERTIGHNPERLCLMKVLCPGTLMTCLPCSKSRCMDKALLWQVSLPDTMREPSSNWLQAVVAKTDAHGTQLKSCPLCAGWDRVQQCGDNGLAHIRKGGPGRRRSWLAQGHAGKAGSEQQVQGEVLV